MTNDDTRPPSPDDQAPGAASADLGEDSAAEDTAPLSSEPEPPAPEAPVAEGASAPQNPWGSAWGTPPAESANPYGSAPPPAEGPAATQPPDGPPGETPPPPVPGDLYGDGAATPVAPPAYPASGQQYGAPPPPPQGGYGAPPPAYGAPGVGGSRQNVLAIIALVAGILGIPCCGCFVFGITATITGFIARRQIAASNGSERGDGLALAGLILGIVGILLGIVVTILQISGAIDSNYSYNFDTN